MLDFLPKPAQQFAGGIKPLLISFGAFIYLISPIDFLPEILVGPIGYIDDLIVLGLAMSNIAKALKAIGLKKT